MAFNPVLAERVRKMFQIEGIVEKKMFGGVGYLINGNMACGVHGDHLIVRVGKEKYAENIAHPAAKPFDLTGTAMAGWVEIIPAGTSDDNDLKVWIQKGVDFALSLPVKNP